MSGMLSSPQSCKSPLWAVMEIVRNGPAKGQGRGCTSAGLSVNSQRVLAGAERIGLLLGVLIRVGLIEALPVVFSKNSSGNGAEGKRRGLLQELGGTPHPLPLPARPCVRKCRRVRVYIWEGPGAITFHTPFSYGRGGPGGLERGKDWPAATQPKEKVPDGRLSSSRCFSRVATGL